MQNSPVDVTELIDSFLDFDFPVNVFPRYKVAQLHLASQSVFSHNSDAYDCYKQQECQNA